MQFRALFTAGQKKGDFLVCGRNTRAGQNTQICPGNVLRGGKGASIVGEVLKILLVSSVLGAEHFTAVSLITFGSQKQKHAIGRASIAANLMTFGS